MQQGWLLWSKVNFAQHAARNDRLEKLVVCNVERDVLQEAALEAIVDRFILGEGKEVVVCCSTALCILYNGACAKVNFVFNTRYQHFLNYRVASFCYYAALSDDAGWRLLVCLTSVCRVRRA